MTGSDYRQVTEVVIDVVLAMLRNEPGRVSAGVGGLAEENYNQVAELLGESARWLLHNLDEKYEAGAELDALVAEMNTMFVDGFFAPDVQDSLLYLRMLTEGSDGSLADHGFGPLGQLMFQLSVTAGLSGLLGVRRNRPVDAGLRGVFDGIHRVQ